MPEQPPIDAQRLVQRAANAAAGAVADLAVRLAMAEELRDLHATRVAELERELEQARAETARLAQANEQLTAQASDGEHPAGRG